MAHKTDRFLDRKWGVLIHLLNRIQNNHERVENMGAGETDWSEYIGSLDAELIADQLAEINAGYLFLTILQVSRHMLAPNETFDRITGYKPGEACVKRDFIEDMYQALNKRGIDLMLYYTGDGPHTDPKAGPAFGYTEMVDKITNEYVQVSTEFVQKWADVARDYSLRYGSKVKGWWVDGTYSFIDYDEPKLKLYADAMRAGNPDAIVAFNSGYIKDRVSAYSVNDDFTTGEHTEFKDIPDERFIEGAQWHILSYLGIPPNVTGGIYDGWGRPGSRYTGEYMRDYITKVNSCGGVVTIDACMYRDGRIDEDQMQVLRQLKNIR